MKKLQNVFFLAVIVMAAVFTGCTSYKHVPYLQNSREVDLSTLPKLYDARIMPKDVLSISVNCPDDDNAARPFNLVVQANRNGNTGASALNQSLGSNQYSLQHYIVTNEGTINFPKLGTLKVAGMTKTELEAYITGRIYPAFLREAPIVTVTMSNFKVSILGEVGHPCVATTENGKLNIFEALAQAGDLTIYGNRQNVKIIRENAQGGKNIVELDLNDANIINSPYYQLQQNDIIYVTPNKVKAKSSGIGSETSLWFSSVGIVISVAGFLMNVLK